MEIKIRKNYLRLPYDSIANGALPPWLTSFLQQLMTIPLGNSQRMRLNLQVQSLMFLSWVFLSTEKAYPSFTRLKNLELILFINTILLHSDLVQNVSWGPPSHPLPSPLSTKRTVPLPFSVKGITAVARQPLLANSVAHSFDSVITELSFFHLLGSRVWLFVAFPGRLPVSQPTPINLDRLQHELRLHPCPDKVAYVIQGLQNGLVSPTF